VATASADAEPTRILIFGIFAALNELLIAPAIVNGLHYAILVAVGGGGIRTMQRCWERASASVEMKSTEIKQNANPDAARMRAEGMKDG
jgi:Na+/H+-translocating membrane pyrophosphatase